MGIFGISSLPVSTISSALDFGKSLDIVKYDYLARDLKTPHDAYVKKGVQKSFMAKVRTMFKSARHKGVKF